MRACGSFSTFDHLSLAVSDGPLPSHLARLLDWEDAHVGGDGEEGSWVRAETVETTRMRGATQANAPPALAAPLLLAWILTPGPAGAQTPLEPPRVDEAEIELDGRLDEEAWAHALRFTSWHQLTPDEGEQPSEPTEMWLFHDGEHLYLGARAVSAGTEVVSRTFERNSFHDTDQDGVAIVLDTNNDDQTAYGFIVTPDGSRTDVAISDEVRTQWNGDWNAFWDAATHRDEEGWSAEVRIPFSSLRYSPGADGGVEMGVILWRFLAYNDEFSVYPAIPNNWANAAYKPSQTRPVRFEGVDHRTPLYLQPYVRTASERDHRLNEAGTAYDSYVDNELDAGLDLRYNVTNNLVLDLTYNTDFAQVEADDERFNLDRFGLFFPEKRQFFQERSDLFTFRWAMGIHRLFHSRRIGIHRGQPVPMRGGGRLTGQIGDWELGLLNVQTGSAEVLGSEVPSENFGVVRVRRPVHELGSYVGGMFTSRTDFSGGHNVVYALDADIHLGRGVYVLTQAGHGLRDDADPGKTTAAAVLLQRRVGRGFSFGSSFTHFGEEFDAGVGYVPRVAMNRWGHRTQYTWFPGSGHPIQNHSLIHRFEFIWDHAFRELETTTSSLTWRLDLRNNSSLSLAAEYTDDRVPADFRVGDILVPADRYRFLEGSAEVATPSGRSFEFEVGAQAGQYFDGRRVAGNAAAYWNPSPRLSLGLENVYNRIRLPEGTSDVLINRLRAGFSLREDLTARSFIQFNNHERLVRPNLRLRYNPREGNDLYVVYDESVNTALDPRSPGDPRLPRSGFRSLQIKYTHTFQW